jgi:HSP20 family protein
VDVLKGKVARELAALERELDELLERTLGGSIRPPGRADRFLPPTDVYETKEGTVVEIEVAGVRPEDIRLIVDGEYLQITGRRERRPSDPPERYIQMEIARGSFERVLRVAVPYDADRVEASVEAGILRILLPHGSRATRRIPVGGS